MTCISIIFSFVSLVISIWVAFENWYKSRPNLELIQTDDSDRSIFIKSYDGSIVSLSGNISEEETGEPKLVSVLLIEFILINKSSLPISILEFRTPGFQAFSFYSPTLSELTVTSENGSKMQIKQIDYMQPEFTIDPYTSRRGYILFWEGLETDLDVTHPLPLSILTSRETFNFNIKVSTKYESNKKYGNINIDKNGNKSLTLFESK